MKRFPCSAARNDLHLRLCQFSRNWSSLRSLEGTSDGTAKFRRPRTGQTLADRGAFFGGLAQFLAGMWSFHARDALATAMHGKWGSFWMAYGLLFLLAATGKVTIPTGAFPALGFWFIALAAITWIGMFAALATNASLVVVLGTLAAGSTVAAIGFIVGSSGLVQAAGWIFIASAIAAWYTASAIMLEEAFGRSILPVWQFDPAKDRPELSAGLGEPGVIHGQ